MKTILLAMLALSSSSAQAADTFNLNCKGQWRFSAGEPYEPRAAILRFDLAAKKYCESDCKHVRDIAEVSPSYIELEELSEEAKANGTTMYHRIDRTTGEYTHFVLQHRPRHSFIDVKMQCEPARFTGFPVLPTKF